MGTVTRNDLTWSATPDKDWIKVNPMTGAGDASVSVKVENAEIHSDDLEGTVVVRCTSCSILEGDDIVREIRVCRCSCDCGNITLTEYITGLPEAGAKTGTVIAKYRINPDNGEWRCADTAMSATIKNLETGEVDDLNIRGGSVSLNRPIPYNQHMHAHDYEVILVFDGEECKRFQFTQDALECNCNVSLNNFQWVLPVNSENKVVQSGLTAGTVVFTFDNKEYCPIDIEHIKATIEYVHTSYSAQVEIKNGTGEYNGKVIGVLVNTIGENTNTNEREIHFNVEYTGTTTTTPNCKEKTYYQIGCNCTTALKHVGEHVDFGFTDNVIKTFGVPKDDIIGYYRMNRPETSCSDSNNLVTLVLRRDSDGKIFATECANGNIYLREEGGIVENITKKPIEYTAIIYYHGEKCDSKIVEQPGVVCICEDVHVSFLFNTVEEGYEEGNPIPQKGLPAGTVFGEVKFDDERCGTDCCLRIKYNGENNFFDIVPDESRPGVYLLKLRNAISLLDDVAPRQFTFEIFYVYKNEEGDIRDPEETHCTDITIIQKPLVCSCDNVKIIDGRALTVLPLSGTGPKFVEVAKLDVGLYNSDHTILLGTCGSAFGYNSGTTYLVAPDVRIYNEDNKILTEVVDKGDGFIHLFSIQAKVSPYTETDTFAINGYYSPDPLDDLKDVEQCNYINPLVKVDDTVCNCTLPPVSPKEIECTGGDGILLLTLTGVHKDMLLDAKDAETGKYTQVVLTYNGVEIEGAITNITSSEDSSLGSFFNKVYKIYGNIPVGNKGEEKEYELVITPICLATEQTSEWGCVPIPYPIKQKACPNCDCDSIEKSENVSFSSHIGYDAINIDYYEYNKEIKIACVKKTYMPDCLIMKIKGDEDFVEEGEWYVFKYKENEYDEEEKIWFKAQVKKIPCAGQSCSCIETFYLDLEIVNHRDKEYTIRIDAAIEQEGEEELTICEKEVKVQIKDNTCSCYYFNNEDNREHNKIYELFNDGEGDHYGYKVYKVNFTQSETTKVFAFFPCKYCDCLGVWLVKDDETDCEKYKINIDYGSFEAEIVKVDTDYDSGYNDCTQTDCIEGNAVKVTLKDGFEPQAGGYDIKVMIGHKTDVETEEQTCEICEDVMIVVCEEMYLNFNKETCNCDLLKNTPGYCNYKYYITFNNDVTTRETGITISQDLSCFGIRLKYGDTPEDTRIYCAELEQVEFTIDGKIDITFSKSSNIYTIHAELKDNVNLGNSKYTITIEYFLLGEGCNSSEPCCTSSVEISQNNCYCDDIKEAIHYNKDVNNNKDVDTSFCSEIPLEVEDIVGYLCGGKVQLYLLCDKSYDGDICECGGYDKDGSGDIDGDEEYICIYTDHDLYPDKYKYLGSMPRYDDSQKITILEPFIGEYEGDFRVTHFIAFWVDDEGNFIKINDQGLPSEDGKYCSQEFTITEIFEVNCKCVEEQTDSDYARNYLANHTTWLHAGEDLSFGTNYHIATIDNIEKKYISCLNFEASLNPLGTGDLINVSLSQEDDGKYKIEVNVNVNKPDGMDVHTTVVNLNARTGTKSWSHTDKSYTFKQL